MALPTVSGVAAGAGGYLAYSTGLDKALIPILGVVGSLRNMIQGMSERSQRLEDRQTTTIEDTAQISDNSDLQINLLQEILEVNRAQFSFMVASATKAARARAQQMLDDIEARREVATIGDTDDDASAAPSRRGRGLLGRLGSLFQGNILEFLGISALLRFFTKLRTRLLPMTKAFGKIFLAVTAIYDFITGFNEEFDPEKQNWGQAGIAGIANVVKGILAIPAKIGKWAVENILRTFGLEKTADQVKNWDEDQWLDNLIATYYKRDGEYLTLGNFITRAIAMPAEIGRWVAKQALMAFGYTQEEADKYVGSGNIGDALYDMLPNAASIGPAVVKFFKETLPQYATDISNWFYTSEENHNKKGHFQLFGMSIPTWDTLKKTFSDAAKATIDFITDIPNMVGRFFTKTIKEIGHFIYHEGEGKHFLFGFELPTWSSIKETVMEELGPAIDFGKEVAAILIEMGKSIKAFIIDLIPDLPDIPGLAPIKKTKERLQREQKQFDLQKAVTAAPGVIMSEGGYGIVSDKAMALEQLGGVSPKDYAAMIRAQKQSSPELRNFYEKPPQINIVNGGSTINNLGMGGNNSGGGSNRTTPGSSRTPVPGSGWAFDGKYGPI